MWEFETVGNGAGESIEFGDLSWIVLDKSVDEKKKLLLCRQDFYEYWLPEDCDEREKQGGDFTWKISGAREFLNSQFIQDHFSDEEKARILEVKIENKGNPFADAHESAPTTDRVFMLSLEEAIRYFKANPEAEQFAILEEQVFYTRTPMFRKLAVSPILFNVDEQWGEWVEDFDFDDEENDRSKEIDAVFPAASSSLAGNALNAWVDITESDINVRPAMWIAC